MPAIWVQGIESYELCANGDKEGDGKGDSAYCMPKKRQHGREESRGSKKIENDPSESQSLRKPKKGNKFVAMEKRAKHKRAKHKRT